MEFAYLQDEEKLSKEWVEKSQNWLSAAVFPFLPPSSCVVCLSSGDPICIYYDSSRFALLWVFFVCFVTNGKGNYLMSGAML